MSLIKNRFPSILPLLAVLILPVSWKVQKSFNEIYNEIDIHFPAGVTFYLDISSTPLIEDVDLLYGTSARSCQEISSRKDVEFEQKTEVRTDWFWDWERSGVIPPGAEIWWQWEVTNEDGDVYQTWTRRKIVQDDRHIWQSLENDRIKLQWYAGNEAFGQYLFELANQSLDRLESDMGLPLEEFIHITVYPSTDDLKEAIPRTAEWVGGVAFPQHHSILLAASPDDDGWAESGMPHEMSHLVVSNLFFNCTGATMPTWLSEGLSVYAEGLLTPSELFVIEKELDRGELPLLNSLSNGFSAYGDDAVISYIQSGFVVKYLYDNYGKSNILNLIEILKAGSSIDDALESVFGLDTDRLDAAWRESLGYQLDIMDDEPDGQPTKTYTPVPTVALFNPGLQPTSTETPVIPTATHTPEPSATTLPPTTTHTLVPDSGTAETPEETSPVSGKIIAWISGIGAVVLIGVLVFRKIIQR